MRLIEERERESDIFLDYNQGGDQRPRGTSQVQHLGLNSQQESLPREVVLEWMPPLENLPVTQQARTSSDTNDSVESQSPGAPQIRVLNERIQRLEAALVERTQPRNENEEIDRPPAYDSLPITPGSGSS